MKKMQSEGRSRAVELYLHSVVVLFFLSWKGGKGGREEIGN